jgi:hypothetical protein
VCPPVPAVWGGWVASARVTPAAGVELRSYVARLSGFDSVSPSLGDQAGRRPPPAPAVASPGFLSGVKTLYQAVSGFDDGRTGLPG